MGIPVETPADNVAAFNALKAAVGLSADAARQTVPNSSTWTAAPSGQVAPRQNPRFTAKMQKPAGVKRLAHFGLAADMYSPSGWAADVTDTEGSLYGDTVTRITLASGTHRDLMQASFLSTPVDMSGGGQLRIRFRPVANQNLIDRFSLDIYSAGSPASLGADFHSTSDGRDVARAGGGISASHPFRALSTSLSGLGRLQTVSFSTAELRVVGAGANLSAIIGARLWLRGSGSTVLLDIEGIDYIPNPRTKAAVVFSFDDGYLLPYSARQLTKRGWPAMLYPGAFALTIGGGVQNLTPRNLKNLHDILGWQVAAQSFSSEQLTYWQGLTPAQRSAEISALMTACSSLGLTGMADGSWHSTTLPADVGDVYDVFEQNFRTMRLFSTANASGVPLTYGETWPIGDPMMLRCMAMSGTTARNRAHVDNAVSNKSLAMFAVHGEIESPGTLRTAFDDIVSYCETLQAAGSIEVTTLDRLLA